PDFIPAWLMPDAIPCGRVIEGRRLALGVARPADGPPGHACRSLDPPPDGKIRRRALSRRAGVDVVPRGGPRAAVPLEDREADAVLVGELRARVRARGAVD